jgi:hypothetical protein
MINSVEVFFTTVIPSPKPVRNNSSKDRLCVDTCTFTGSARYLNNEIGLNIINQMSWTVYAIVW